jgi:hypothetical protein
MAFRNLSLGMAAAAFVVLASCTSGLRPAPERPAAGWAVVMGNARYANGNPVRNAEVLVTACDQPIQGLAGTGRTDENGDYRVVAQMPAGAPGDAIVECRVVVARGLAQAIGVRVRFRSLMEEAEANPIVVDLRQGAR